MVDRDHAGYHGPHDARHPETGVLFFFDRLFRVVKIDEKKTEHDTKASVFRCPCAFFPFSFPSCSSPTDYAERLPEQLYLAHALAFLLFKPSFFSLSTAKHHLLIGFSEAVDFSNKDRFERCPS